MCGINGIISNNISKQNLVPLIQKMNILLKHRGPDASLFYSDENVALGHTRLSIIDLSETSNQPFYSNDNRYVIVYNGELYNYKQLKLSLQQSVHGSGSIPYIFKTQSDTEVVLAAYLKWGKQCLNYFNGMFAFSIYDKHTKQTFIARDRFGVKPLYYHYYNDAFIFSSEIRAIINCGLKSFSLNKESLPEYTQYQSTNAPNTIVKGVKLLEPGSYIEIINNTPTITTYYTPEIKPSEKISYKETTTKINELLYQSVQLRLEADVPFGAFLSGGIDSSAIVGIMSDISSEPINTFNISFDESEFSESKYAKQISEKFNTNHTEIKLTPEHFLKTLPEALDKMDSPGGDGINTYIVSKATKNAGITMAMSGIGGDELFAGYDVFKNLFSIQKKQWLNLFPNFIRRSAGKGLVLKEKNIRNFKLAEVLSQDKINIDNCYKLSRALFTKKQLQTLIKLNNKITLNNYNLKNPDYVLSTISINEISTYLTNTLLRDTDQMSMAVALEVREPFLDYKLVDYVLNVPDEYKYPTTPKKLLIDSLNGLVPNEIINRPKMGFTLPWKYWMQNELKDFCQKNITSLEQKNIFHPNSIKNLWDGFLKNDATITWSRVWHLIVLNYWIDKNKINID
jgi:asparagine synthase (glutamine-hydrolysing)